MLRPIAKVTRGFFHGPTSVSADVAPHGQSKRNQSADSEMRQLHRGNAFVSAISPSSSYLARIYHGLCYIVGISSGHCDTMRTLPFGKALSPDAREHIARGNLPTPVTGIIATSLCFITCSLGRCEEILCVGHSDGSIRAYTVDEGRIVFSERYHKTSPIVRLKLQATSVLSQKSSLSTFSELWMLHGDGTLVVVHLSQLNRAIQCAFNGSKPTKGCRHLKWKLQRQLESTDFVAAPPSRPNLFQFKTRPTRANILVCGSQPFCSLFHADGDNSNATVSLQDAVTDLVGWAGGAVLSSAAAFAPSWLSGIAGHTRTRKKERSSHRNEENGGSIWNDLSSESLSCPLKRHRPLRDDPRHIISSVLAPPVPSMPRIAVLADSLGRVLLVDVDNATVMRVFKGYRNAQCGWITMENQGILGCYLVVYAPNRNRLKIWRSVHGPLICSVKVPESTAGSVLHTTVSWDRGKTHATARCFLLGKGALPHKSAKDSTSQHFCIHEVELPELQASRTLERQYLFGGNQEECFLLAQFVEALSRMVTSTGHIIGNNSSRRRTSDPSATPDGTEVEGANKKVPGVKFVTVGGDGCASPVVLLTNIIDQIDTPELIVRAADAVNELFCDQNIGQPKNLLPCNSSDRTGQIMLASKLISRIFSRMYEVVYRSHQSRDNVSSERRKSFRRSLRLLGTQAALFPAYAELYKLYMLASKRKLRKFSDVTDGNSDSDSEADLFGFKEDSVKDKEMTSIVAAHVKQWTGVMGCFTDTGTHSDEEKDDLSTCVAPLFFSKCIKARLRVLETNSIGNAQDPVDRFIAEIDDAQPSSFGIRPYRCRVLSCFIFQSLMQHVFSMGLQDQVNGHSFRRVQALFLHKMAGDKIMELFATFWFDDSTTRKMIGVGSLSKIGSVSGPPESSAAARWLFECTLNDKFIFSYHCEQNTTKGTSEELNASRSNQNTEGPTLAGAERSKSAFGILYQYCVKSSDLLKAVLLARMCSRAWAQSLRQNNVTEAIHLVMKKLRSMSDEDRNEYEDEEEWDASLQNFNSFRMQESKTWARLARRLEICLYSNCALGRYEGLPCTQQGVRLQNVKPVSLELLMSGNPECSLARLIAEYQLSHIQDAGNAKAFMTMNAHLKRNRSHFNDMKAVEAMVKETTSLSDEEVFSYTKSVDRGDELGLELRGNGLLSEIKAQQEAGEDLVSYTIAYSAWKWFGEDSKTQNSTSGYAPTTLLELIRARDHLSSENSRNDEIPRVLATSQIIASVLPHVGYDFDCIAAHRSLVLAELGKPRFKHDNVNVTGVYSAHTLRNAIASISHAMMIESCDDSIDLSETKICTYSLRTLVLLEIWNKSLSPLFKAVSSVWSMEQSEAVGAFRRFWEAHNGSSFEGNEHDEGNRPSINGIHVDLLISIKSVLESFLTTADTFEKSSDKNLCAELKDATLPSKGYSEQAIWPLVRNPLRAQLAENWSPCTGDDTGKTNVHVLSIKSIKRHLQCVSAQIAIVQHSLWQWEFRQFFVHRSDLFEPDSLFIDDSTGNLCQANDEIQEPETSNSPLDALQISLMGRRLQLVVEVAVASSIDEALSVAAELSCDHEVALVECIRILLLTGRDADIILMLNKLDDALQQRVAGKIVAIVSEQVVSVLSVMRKDRRYRSLVATIPADMYKSVRVAARAARDTRATLQINDPSSLKKVSPSLSGIHSLLAAMAPLLTKGSKELQECVVVAGVVGTLYKGAKASQEKMVKRNTGS